MFLVHLKEHWVLFSSGPFRCGHYSKLFILVGLIPPALWWHIICQLKCHLCKNVTFLPWIRALSVSCKIKNLLFKWIWVYLKKLVWTPVLNPLLLVPIASLGGVHQPTHLGPHTRLVLGPCTPTWETSLSGPTDEWLVLVVYTSSSHLLLHRRHSSQTYVSSNMCQKYCLPFY